MITPSRAVRVFGYPAPCDMRKGYDSLGALVRDSLEQDLLDGDMFLFVARNRKRAKVLFFDGPGTEVGDGEVHRVVSHGLDEDTMAALDPTRRPASPSALPLVG